MARNKRKGQAVGKSLKKTKAGSIAKTRKRTPPKSSISAKGWHQMAPKRGKERQELFDKCGEKCFLRPSDLGFPVCEPVGKGRDCEINDKGVQAALMRARTFHYDKIISKAKKLQTNKRK